MTKPFYPDTIDEKKIIRHGHFVYITATLIPLTGLALLLKFTVFPELLNAGKIMTFYSSVGMLALAFVLSFLGYLHSLRGTQKYGTQMLKYTRESFDRLVAISASISEAPHIHVVAERVAEGAAQLTEASSALFFLKEPSGWSMRADTGLEWAQLGDKDTERLKDQLENAAKEKRVISFDADFLRNRYLSRQGGKMQGLAAPLMMSDMCCGAVLVINKQEPSGLFTNLDNEMMESFSRQAVISLKNAEFREIQINYFSHTIELLVLIMEGNIVPKDHLRNVAQYSDMISRKLHLNDDDRRNIHFAALMHDVGLVKIPSELHAKPEHYRLHALMGAEMVGRIVLWKDLVPIIRSHHENFDGTGYPDGLTGDHIPLAARVVTIAESFDAMTNTYTYRSRLSVNAAVEELKRNAGRRYDSKLVEIFQSEIQTLDLE